MSIDENGEVYYTSAEFIAEMDKAIEQEAQRLREGLRIKREAKQYVPN
jgi:hypothetical protein